MKIAQVVTLKESVPPRSQNGLEFLVSWLVEELVKRGHDVTLFGPADSRTSARLVPLLPQGTNSDETGWGQPHFSIWNTVFAGSMANEFDIIHCHDFFGAYIAPFVSQPIVQTMHHPYRDEFLPRFIQKAEHAMALRFVIEQYRRIHYVPISRRQEEFFEKGASSYFEKHCLIHNGIPVEQFVFNASPDDYLFYIGYLNRDKGADAAVRVARALGCRLILAGNNFGQEKFFVENIEPYLGEDIQYVGPVDFKKKVELYRNAKALLVPLNWHEPFGLTLIEAQACGTPVIALNKGAAMEIVKDNETGFVVETEDEMAEAVRRVPSIDRRACRSWVEKNFTVEKMTDAYEALYQRLAAQPKPR